MKQAILRTARNILVAACLCSLLLAAGAHAAQVPSSVGFAVRAIPPEHQMEDVTGYFALLLPPGQRQTLEIEIVNHQNAPLRVRLEINAAQSNKNGLIAYTTDEGAGSRFDLAMLRLDRLSAGPGLPIQDITGDILTLAPNASVRVPIEAFMPEEGLPGQALGGIVITRLDTPQAGGDGFAVRSIYSYAIALQMQSEVTPSASPSFTLADIVQGTVAGHDALTVAIQNTSPLVVTGASLRVRLYAQGNSLPLADITADRVSLTPEGTLPYTALLPRDVSLTPGSYTVTATLTHEGVTTTLEGTLHVEGGAK